MALNLETVKNLLNVIKNDQNDRDLSKASGQATKTSEKTKEKKRLAKERTPLLARLELATFRLTAERANRLRHKS